MNERNPRVRLLDDMARCVPSMPCPRKATCARYLSPIPAHGGSVADFSLAPMVVLVCHGYVSTEQAQAQPAKPRKVHPGW